MEKRNKIRIVAVLQFITMFLMMCYPGTAISMISMWAKPTLVLDVLFLLFYILCIAAVINVLRLRNWARKLSTGINVVLIISNLITLPFLDWRYFKLSVIKYEVIEFLVLYILPLWIIFYFTRPKVKEQFK